MHAVWGLKRTCLCLTSLRIEKWRNLKFTNHHAKPQAETYASSRDRPKSCRVTHHFNQFRLQPSKRHTHTLTSLATDRHFGRLKMRWLERNFWMQIMINTRADTAKAPASLGVLQCKKHFLSVGFCYASLFVVFACLVPLLQHSIRLALNFHKTLALVCVVTFTNGLRWLCLEIVKS